MKVTKVDPLPPTPPPERYIIELDALEARLLQNLLGNITGGYKDGGMVEMLVIPLYGILSDKIYPRGSKYTLWQSSLDLKENFGVQEQSIYCSIDDK